MNQPDESVEFSFKNEDDKIRISANHGDIEVGYMIMETDGIVREVSVERDWRRKGIATEMVRYAMKQRLHPRYHKSQKMSTYGTLWTGKLGKKLVTKPPS